MHRPGGVVRLTTSGVVLVSGDPVRVYGIQVTSSATAAVPTFMNGTTSSGTAYYTAQSAVANKQVGESGFPPGGILFPGGLYVSFDANTTAVVVECEAVSTL